MVKNEKTSTATSIWGSEDEEAINRKQEFWKKMREKQRTEIERQIKMFDFMKVVAVILIFRKLSSSFKYPLTKVSLTLLTLIAMKTIYDARAPTRNFELEPGGFRVFPFFGQIGIVFEVLKKGAANVQLEVVKNRNFSSNEIVMFGDSRDTSIMDPRDREYILKTNWKNFVKNNPDGTGFQEMFAEIMGRGIFAVVSIITTKL